MKLFLLRHGDAIAVGAEGVARDEDRPLSRRGIDQIRKAAGAIRAWGIRFDAILSSPYLRARQTAEIMAAEGTVKIPIEETLELIPGPDPLPILETLSLRPQAGQLLLVGHLPLLGRLASFLLSGGGSPEVPFHPGAMACFVLKQFRPRPAARLEWFLGPEQYPE